MKELEIDLPKPSDGSIVARIKRLHFYSVREEFLHVWKDHEQFLVVYEERVKKALLRQAKMGENNNKPVTNVVCMCMIFLFDFIFSKSRSEYYRRRDGSIDRKQYNFSVCGKCESVDCCCSLKIILKYFQCEFAVIGTRSNRTK